MSSLITPPTCHLFSQRVTLWLDRVHLVSPTLSVLHFGYVIFKMFAYDHSQY